MAQVVQKPPEYCPLCTTQGKISKIVPFFINIEEAVYLCSNEHCQYPYGYDDFVFMPLGHLSTQEQVTMCNSKHEEKDSDYLTDDILSAFNDISSNDVIPWSDSLLFSPEFCENLQFDDSIFGPHFEMQSSNDSKFNMKQKNVIIETHSLSHVHTSPKKNSCLSSEENAEKKPSKDILILSDIKLPNFSTLSKNNLKEFKCNNSDNIIIEPCDTVTLTEEEVKNQASQKIEILTSASEKGINTLLTSDNKTEYNPTESVMTNNIISLNSTTKVSNFATQQCNINKSINAIEHMFSITNTKERRQSRIKNPVLLKKIRMLQSISKKNLSKVNQNASKNLNVPAIIASNSIEHIPLLSEIKISYLTPIDNQHESLTLSVDLNDISNSNLLPLSSNVDVGEIVKADNINKDSSIGTKTWSLNQSEFDNFNSIMNLDSGT